ncbi:MAG: hypothetical protein EAX95_09650 [Candidatus Thorarchaeota archaeon]|nr:hypothetical protein [Candidatus Thorarchaeota archaeon]
MAFETYPIVIDLFAVLVVVSATISFVVAYALSQGWIDPVHGDISRLMKRAKLILTLAIGLPVLLMFIVPPLGFWLDIEILALSFYVFHGLIHIETVVFVGVFLGLVLAIGYYIRGVSGYCLLTFFVLLLPVWAVLGTGDAELILGFALDGLDSLVFAMLFFLWEPTLITKLLGWEEETSKSAIAIISRDMARSQVARSIESLKTRAETEGDSIAKEAIEILQETEGAIGQLIAKAIASSEFPKSMEYPAEDTLPDSYQVSLRRAAMGKRPKPRGIWMLTNSEFMRRVRLNRFVYLVLLFAMIGLTIGALTDMSLHVNQWIGILSTGIIITSLALAFLDSTFVGRRLSANSVVKHVLKPLSGIDELLIDEPSAEEEIAETAHREQMLGDEETEGEVAFLTDEHIVAASGHTRKFLERVRPGKNEVYEESIMPLFVEAAGILMSFPTGLLAVLTYSETLVLFNDALVILFLLGITVIVIGALWWLKWTRERSFYGIRRSILASAISYLDIREAGIENIGLVTYPTPQAHVVLIKFRGPIAANITLEKLGKSANIRRDLALTKETIEFERRSLRLVWFLFAVAVAVGVFMILIIGSFHLDVLMLSLCGIMLASLVVGYISYYRRKQALMHEETSPLGDEPVETLSQILKMIEMEYKFPLRVHVIRNHKELLYTGTTFATTTGVILREAVFLPK